MVASLVALAGEIVDQRRRQGRTDIRMASAAVAHQETDRLLNLVQIGPVDDRATLALGNGQSRTGQHGQMRRHGVVRYLQLPGDLTGRKPRRLVSNKQPQCRQARLLG